MLKLLALTAVIITLATPVLARDVYVKGHTTKSGTYVEPHYRTAPDSSRYNNYSTQGNTNPYTGEAGTVNPNNTQSNNSGYNNSYNNGYSR